VPNRQETYSYKISQIYLNKRKRKPKGQWKDNSEKLATYGLQDEDKQKHNTIR